MVIVAVLAQTVGRQEVCRIAVAVLEPGNYIIPGNGSLESLLAGDLPFVGVVAIALDAGHIGAEQPDRAIARGVHVSTSSQSAVK